MVAAAAPEAAKKRRKSSARAGDKPAEAESAARKAQKSRPKKKGADQPELPSWGTASAAGDQEEELNPGMLLADLVGEADGVPGPRPVARGRGKKAKKAAEAEAPEEEVDMAAWSGDDEEEHKDAAGDGGDRLLAAIGSLPVGTAEEGGAAASIAARRRAMQAQPESEFHAGAVGEEVTVEDLLAPLAEAPSFGDVRKQLEGLASAEKLPEPLSEVKRGREERAAQYENTKRDQGKWIPQVQEMRKAEQVVLGEGNEHKPTSTASLVEGFKPVDDFERELEELTKAAGATEEDVKGAEALPINPRIRDEKQIQQVAKLKFLMLREQQTKRRVNKIKSKTYRRIHRKAESREREALLERLETENPELANTLKQEYEKKRAQDRLLRQRNARKKWTGTMQRFAKGDKNAAREISKQAQAAHDERMSLRRAIAGKDPNQDEDSDAVDLSGSDGENEVGGKRRGVAKDTIDKAKKLTVNELKDLEKGGELPTTGILGMGFMREAIKKKREAAKQEAQNVLQELEVMDKRLGGSDDEDDDDDSSEAEAKKANADAAAALDAAASTGKRREFTAAELASAREQVDSMLENDGEGVECSVAGPLSVWGVEAAKNPKPKAKSKASKDSPSNKPVADAEAAQEMPSGGGSSSSRPPRKTGKAGAKAAAAAAVEAAANPWLDLPTSTDAAASAETSAAPAAETAGKTGKKRKRRKGSAGAGQGEADVAPDAEEIGTAEDVLSALNADSTAAQEQRDLVRTAFVEGTQMEDFEDEQEEKRRQKEDAANQDDRLMGWGHWAGSGITPRKPKGKGKGKGKGKEGKGKGKEDAAKSSRVAYHEGSNTEAAKYFIDQVPYGFQNPAQYEQQMNMPTGPEWNSLPSHMQKIKPKMFVKVGKIVHPLQYVKHLPTDQRDDALKTWSASKQPKRLKAKI